MHVSQSDPTPSSLFSQDDSDPSLKSTINLLDSLLDFYQQECIWVYKTRASLSEISYSPSSQSDSSSNESQSSASPSPPSSVDTDIVKSEPMPSPPIPPSRSSSSSRWSHRKRGFKLRLDGIASARRRASPLHRSQSASARRGPNPREHILELFEKMMESRMESCERVNRLVKNANRADLYTR